MTWTPEQQVKNAIESASIAKTITVTRASVEQGTFTGIPRQTSGINMDDGSHIIAPASATMVQAIQPGDVITWTGTLATATGYRVARCDFDGAYITRILLDHHLG